MPINLSEPLDLGKSSNPVQKGSTTTNSSSGGGGTGSDMKVSEPSTVRGTEAGAYDGLEFDP